MFCLGSLGRVACSSKKISAMELDGEVGIFEEMARQNQNDGLTGFDESAPAQLLESSERDGGSRFATDAIGADFGFGSSDFNFRDLFDLAAGCLQHAQRFFPRCRIADAYGGRERVGSHRFELLPAKLAHAAVERVRAVRLDDGKLRQARDQFELTHFEKRLADRGTVSQIASGDDDVVGRLPRELLHEFDGGGFLAFDAIRINRIQQVDRFLADEVVEDADASVKISAELAGEGSGVERLRELAPGNFAF